MDAKKKRGKPVGAFKGDEELANNLNIRVSQADQDLLDQHALALDVSRSEVFRGLLHTLADSGPPQIKDGLIVTVGKTPMVISRRQAKQLLRDLTNKLVA